MNILQIFNIKCIGNFRNIEVEKKFRFGGVKMAKSIKIEYLIGKYQKEESVFSVVRRQTYGKWP